MPPYPHCDSCRRSRRFSGENLLHSLQSSPQGDCRDLPVRAVWRRISKEILQLAPRRLQFGFGKIILNYVILYRVIWGNLIRPRPLHGQGWRKRGAIIRKEDFKGAKNGKKPFSSRSITHIMGPVSRRCRCRSTRYHPLPARTAVLGWTRSLRSPCRKTSPA